MSRSRQPSSVFSIVSGRAISTKKSAGPPIPNEVRVASGSCSLTPLIACSQARLDALRQLITQLADVARTHQQQDVVGADQSLERLAGVLEGANVGAVREQVGQVLGLDPSRVVLARAVHIEEQDPVRAHERPREVMD